MTAHVRGGCRGMQVLRTRQRSTLRQSGCSPHCTAQPARPRAPAASLSSLLRISNSALAASSSSDCCPSCACASTSCRRMAASSSGDSGAPHSAVAASSAAACAPCSAASCRCSSRLVCSCFTMMSPSLWAFSCGGRVQKAGAVSSKGTALPDGGGAGGGDKAAARALASSSTHHSAHHVGGLAAAQGAGRSCCAFKNPRTFQAFARWAWRSAVRACSSPGCWDSVECGVSTLSAGPGVSRPCRGVSVRCMLY